MTFRYLSFHGYYHLIRHEFMHMPSGLWQHDQPDDISPRIWATQKTRRRRRKPTGQCCLSACKHVIPFFPVKVFQWRIKMLTFFPSFWSQNLVNDQMFNNLEMQWIFFNLLCLYSLFKSLIRFSDSLAPFAIPSAQHAWSEKHRGAQRSIILLQERSGWL